MALDSREKKGYRWVILAVYMYVSAMSLLFWVNFASIETYMEEQFHYSSVQIIWLAQVFLVAFTILTLPAGIFIDKKGFKAGIGLGVLLTGIFPFIRIIDPQSYPLLLISQIGIACGQPFILNGITKITDAWFPPEEKGTAIGLASLSQTIGILIAFSCTSQLVQHLGFQAMLNVYNVMALIGAVLYFMFVKHNPAISLEQEEVPPKASMVKEIISLVKIRNFTILSLVLTILFSIMSGLLTRIQKILHDLHGLSLTDSGNLVALFLVGGIIGSFLMPFISDRIKRRKITLNTCILVSVIFFPTFIYLGNYTYSLVNGVILGFSLTATVPLMYTISIEIAGLARAGISVGYLQLLGCFSSVLLVFLMQFVWVAMGTPTAPLYLVSGLLIIAFLLSLMLTETFPRDNQK